LVVAVAIAVFTLGGLLLWVPGIGWTLAAVAILVALFMLLVSPLTTRKRACKGCGLEWILEELSRPDSTE
jgi:hypothetical protein